jgi:hypothetical protein
LTTALIPALTRSRPLARPTAFVPLGRDKFLSPFPNWLKSPQEKGNYRLVFKIPVTESDERSIKNINKPMGKSSPGGEETGEGEQKTSFPGARLIAFSKNKQSFFS